VSAKIKRFPQQISMSEAVNYLAELSHEFVINEALLHQYMVDHELSVSESLRYENTLEDNEKRFYNPSIGELSARLNGGRGSNEVRLIWIELEEFIKLIHALDLDQALYGDIPEAIKKAFGSYFNFNQLSLEQAAKVLGRYYQDDEIDVSYVRGLHHQRKIISDDHIKQNDDPNAYNHDLVTGSYIDKGGNDWANEELHDRLEWVTKYDLLSYMINNQLEAKQSPISETPIRRHSTAWLRVIDAAIEEFYPDQNSVDPIKSTFVGWVENRATNEGIYGPKSIAKSVFTIIKRGNRN
jgi:hypothetical protein